MAQKSFHRTDRVAAQLRRELGTLVHHAVREHGLGSTSVSDVEVTRDMAHAKVFVTVLQPEKAKETVKALKALHRAYVSGDMAGDASPADVYATMCGSR